MRFQQVAVGFLRENRGPQAGAIHIYSLEYINWCESHAFRHIPVLNQLPCKVLASLNSLFYHKEQPGVKRNLSSPLFCMLHPTLYERQQAMVHLGQTFALFVYPDLLLRKITFSTI